MKTLLSVSALFIMLFSCKKDDPLPAATQVGANTFGCKVNGKSWIPDGGGGFSGIKPVEGGYLYKRENIYVNAYRSDKTKVELYLPNTMATGQYQLNSNTGVVDIDPSPARYGLYKDEQGTYYITDRQNIGTVEINRNDTTRGIISGTFEFTAVNPTTKKTIRITDGRFDVDSRK